MYQIGIFISHSWAHSGHYDTLADWIFREPGGWNSSGTPIRFVDYSIPKDNPIHSATNDAQLQSAIFAEISKAHVIVCPTGMYSTHSKWIQKELDGKVYYNKKLLPVNPWAQERKSAIVQQYGDCDPVGWQKQSVINGIWYLYLDIVNGR